VLRSCVSSLLPPWHWIAVVLPPARDGLPLIDQSFS
jgi:hypothetical protein